MGHEAECKVARAAASLMKRNGCGEAWILVSNLGRERLNDITISCFLVAGNSKPAPESYWLQIIAHGSKPVRTSNQTR